MLRDDPALKRETLVIAGCDRQTLGYRIRREHGTPNWLILYTVSGAGRFDRTQCPQDSFLMVRPGVAQDYGIGSGADHWEQLWVHVAFAGAYEGYASDLLGNAPYRLILNASAECARWLNRCVNAPTKLHALLELPAINLDFASLYARVSEFVRVHLSEEIGVSDIAASVGLSPSRLSAVLRQQIGVSPRDFLEAERMKLASELVALTNMPIQNIASRVGIRSPFYFSLRFKKAFGVSPTEYRKLAAGKA
jgi:AraC family transcriptional regulator of arabinose operon